MIVPDIGTFVSQLECAIPFLNVAASSCGGLAADPEQTGLDEGAGRAVEPRVVLAARCCGRTAPRSTPGMHGISTGPIGLTISSFLMFAVPGSSCRATVDRSGVGAES